MSEATLTINALQWDLYWEDPEENRRKVENKLENLSNSDVLLLPEMFNTGFTMTPDKIAESMDGPTVFWMKDLAARNEVLIIGSVVIKENEKYFNRALMVFPNGRVDHYDKRHLFSFAGEDKAYTSGKDRVIVEYKGFRICPMICYDLRFPVWSRNTDDIDLMIFMANWPHARVLAWDTLLRARSIENLCYTVGVNRIGEDANGLRYLGHTSAFDALGKEIGTTSEAEEDTLSLILNKKHLELTRRQFRFLEDRDEFELSY